MKKLKFLVAIVLTAKLLFAQINIVDDSFYSTVLQQEMLVDVFLPPDYEANPDQYYPVVYFLHGWGGNQNSLNNYASIANTLMLNGSIDPFIMVGANNQAGPFGGTMYMNSPLWGDFETFNFTEVLNYIEDTYRALPDPNKRALMGQSMGASGCFENGPKYKDKFRAIAAHGYSGVMEYCMDSWQTDLLNEQVSVPPYFFDFNSGGIFTKISFLQSGAVAPNLNCPQTHINPTTVEFILDDQGAFIDTIISKWLDHSGHKLVQELTPDDDFGILFGDGQNDELGFYPGSLALKDSLDAYGIPSQFFSHPGGHSMPTSFMQETYVFLDSIFNIVENSCLPEGITFTTQEEIDNFQINYPNCTEVEGDVSIGDYNGTDITNLNGLSVLTFIGGNLSIGGNDVLSSMTGLDNVTSIGGNLSIGENVTLTSLTGLENVTSVGGDLWIANTAALTSLMGLDNLTSIGGVIRIYFNNSLTNLSGLESLTCVVGDFWIIGNVALTSLTGLDNMTSIWGNLSIGGNDALASLTGLEGLTSIGGNLDIGFPDGMAAYGNPSLTSLEGLTNLSSLGGGLNLLLNTTLASLAGLENLTSIEGNLSIGGNNALASLTGLDNVTSIGGDLEIGFHSGMVLLGNPSLTSLESLANLSSLGGDLHITENLALTNLTGLGSLTTIGGYLGISYNQALSSLTGLENVEASSVQYIFIHVNSNLSECDVKSICDYLSSPNGTINISDNAPGCNSPEEVDSLCNITGIQDKNYELILTISPNPVKDQAALSLNIHSKSSVEFCIYNITGVCIKSWQFQNQQPGEKEFTLDLKGLQAGLYFCQVQIGNKMITKKIIKL